MASELGLLSGAVAVAAIGAAFAAADVALGSLSPLRLTAMADQSTGSRRAVLDRYRENPTKYLSRWLVGRLTCTALTAVLTGQALADRAGRWGPLVAVIGALLLYGTFATVTTVWARGRAQRVAPLLLRALRPLEFVLWPIAAPLTALGERVDERVIADSEPHPDAARMKESEVGYLVDDATKTGTMAPEPAQMIHNVLEFNDLTVSDVMIPRIKTVAIEGSTSAAAALQAVVNEGHSRYPVYRGRIDNVVGILYAKDLFPVLQRGLADERTAEELARAPVNFVPEAQLVSTVLREMRQRRQHMAVVIDEFGGVSGVVTLEDILEQIVGDIRDEHDDEAPIVDIGDGRLLVDASVDLDDLSAYLGTEIASDGDYGSLGGLLTHHAGQVPAVGDHIHAAGLDFIVREADPKRIAKVEILLDKPIAQHPKPTTKSALPPA